MERSSPNIVYIFADEWRAQATGYNGDTNCETPVLDNLASESVSFSNAVSGCSVCCPARASLMTGQYPLTHGVIINDMELNPKVDSIARIFKRSGYETGYIGKWHLYGSPDGNYGRREVYVPREHQLGFDYWKAFECSHDYNNSHYFLNEDPTLHRWDGYDAFPQARDAASFIHERATSGKPFLLMLSWGPPHFPLKTAPEKYRARYKNREIVLRANVPEDNRDLAVEELRGYYAHIAALDDALKIVLDALDQTGLRDDTIVVFTSDHGDMRQSQGLATKMFPFDESIRVPFLLRWPRALGDEGWEMTIPIDIPDHLPTLLGLIKATVPDQIQGNDWSPMITGNAHPTGDEAALLSMAAEFTELRLNDMRPYRGLRTSRYTYVCTTEGQWLLYDNLEDPFQKKNLIDDPNFAILVDQLKSMLDKRLEQLGDTFEDSEYYLTRAGVNHYSECRWEKQRTWRDPWSQPSRTGR